MTPEQTVPLESNGRRAEATTRLVRHLLDAEAFARLVFVERRRSERSGRAFGILVLRAPESLEPAASAMGRAVLGALDEGTRENDVAGWITPHSALGLLLPDLPVVSPWATIESVRARIQTALGRQPEFVSRLTIAGRLFPEPEPWGTQTDPSGPTWRVKGDASDVVAPLLYPELREAAGAHRRTAALKRGLDLVGSAVCLAALAPLMLVIGALVRLTSPGPVLFRQVRVGYRGRPYTMLKFRTMFVNSDETVHRDFVSRFIADGPRAIPADGSGIFKLVGDRRVTPIGRLLRTSSLDELPQLWNVLRGEMSLVGPRPPLAYELQEYTAWHRRRVLEARPGLTGLWQVRGRSRTTFDEMVRLDLQYARTQSLSSDLRILLATPRAVISGKGAR